jgi:uncharacterized protein YllA (UPF0747 family)
VTIRAVTTPIAPPVPPRDGRPGRVSAGLLAATLPGPGRDRLAAGEVLAVTTGQQPGLFTGPLYTIYKALSAIELARRIEAVRHLPVVPVFWVAGDDHDFAEANHAAVLDANGEPVTIVLRERPPEAPALPLWREPGGADVVRALETLRATTPDTEFKADVLQWLEAAYTPTRSLADACAAALHALLGSRGLAVVRPYDPVVKRDMAPLLLRGLDITLPDGLTPVLIEAAQGRDRLRPDGGAFVTRRSGERFTRGELERIAAETPERLSPNVLLRPVVEAALCPTVAYTAGPGELKYFADTPPLYRALDVRPQTPVPRWSGVVVEARVDKVLEKRGLALADLDGPPGALEGRLARDTIPPDVVQAFAELQRHIGDAYGRLGAGVKQLDPTLERTVESARNAALAGTHEIEKKLTASLKRANETVLSQITRARHAVFPLGEPQERVLTYATFAIRYGPQVLDHLEREVARWAASS